MRQVGEGKSARRSSARAALRGCGRVALWAAVALLLLRGIEALVSRPPASSGGGDRGREEGIGYPVEATAMRFARAYLEDPTAARLQPLLAAGAKIGSGRPVSASGAEVAQAEVVRASEVGDGRVIVTVSCELRDARTLYLAVPIVRLGVGEAAVLGAPSIVAVPAVAGADPERPRPVAGPEAGAIEALVGRFLPAYLSARSGSELDYFLVHGATVVPLGGQLELRSIAGVVQLGGGEGPRRTIVAAVFVEDPVSGARYPASYRLDLWRTDRWYVAGVQGALS